MRQKMAKVDQLHQSNKRKIEDDKLGLLQDASLTRVLRDSKSTSRGVLCVFRAHTFVLFFSWMCQKQTAVSLSSAESEVISFDAVFSVDGLPALQCWDCVLQSCPADQPMETLCHRDRVIHSHSHSDTCVFEFVDQVSGNTPNSDAAVLQVINKGQSPTFLHVTRTHRIDLEWLFERVNLDHSILIKDVRTHDQLPEILTDGTFATMEWQSLLHSWHLRQTL